MHLWNIECGLEGFVTIVWNIPGGKSSAVYVNQTKMNVKFSTKLGSSQKSGGAMAYPGCPLELQMPHYIPDFKAEF